MLPEITEENRDKMVVFSHNDVQENNILVKCENGNIKAIQDIKLIDFEYSALNYRGADLAAYLMESMFDNKVKEPPFYGFHPDRAPDFESQDEKSPVNLLLRTYLETYYSQFATEKADDFEKEV